MIYTILLITTIILVMITLITSCEYKILNILSSVGFMATIILSIIMFVAPSHMMEAETEKIVSVQDNRGINGNRYALHSGQDITILVDYNNYKKIKNIDSSIIDIIETNKEKSSLVRVESRYNSNLLNKIYGDQNIATKRIYKLYIPKGTLVEDYNIDLK